MSTIHGVPYPDGGDQTKGPQVLALIWTQTGIASLILVARFYARISTSKLGVDDWLMLLTHAIFIATSAATTAFVENGGYRHIYFLSDDQLARAGELNFILRALVILTYLTGKAAVGALVLRLLGIKPDWRRWIIWITVIITAIMNILNTIFNFVQCIPVKANWTPGLRGDCWAPNVQLDFAYVMIAENIIADVILALLPATFLYELNMSLQRRVNLSIILGLGLFAAICGIVKITTLKEIRDPDYIWTSYGLTVWSMSETFVIIFCGSIPPLKSLFDRIFKTKHSRHGYARNEYPASGETPPYPLNDRNTNRPPSISSQTKWLPGPESRSLKGNEIRATTNIEIVSTKADSGDDTWSYNHLEPR